ncbi:hypothetical protein HMPREF1870_01308 [Bacteroidales bacterium KA00344]|nr:hypothetical protein HMPREF1870_01308 [Bacteroidales bacterium KA00344]
MKRAIFIFVLFLIKTVTYSQNYKINYFVSDSAEIQINKYIKKMKISPKEELCVYIHLCNPNIQLYFLRVLKNDSSSVSRLAQLSNRYLIIEQKSYSIIFDYDFILGTMTPLEEIGLYGYREGTIKKSHLLLHSSFFEYCPINGNIKFYP